MSYQFVATSSQYFRIDSAVVTDRPFTLAAWGRPDNSTAPHAMLSVGNATTLLTRVLIAMRGDVAGFPCRISDDIQGDSSDATTDSSSGFTVNTWGHGTGVFTSYSSRSAYMNGAGKITNTQTESGTVNYEATAIGANVVGTTSPHYFANPTGFLAECAIWSAALTDAEVMSLAKGFKPHRIRPQSLVFYAPLLRNLQDLRKGLALTAVNAPTVANHPRVY